MRRRYATITRRNIFDCSSQLVVCSRRERFNRNINRHMWRNTVSFDALALPCVPASDWHPETIALRQLEVRSTEHFAGRLRADQGCELVIVGEAGDHLGCTMCEFVDEDGYASVERLRTKAFGGKNHRAIPL